MKVRYTRRAFRDREAIFDYLEKENPEAAREILAFIDAKIRDLETMPERHPLVKELGGQGAVAQPLSLLGLLPNPRKGDCDHPYPPCGPPAVARRGVARRATPFTDG
jgi:hypothetical protein